VSAASHIAFVLAFLTCFGFAMLLAAAEVSLVRVRRAQVGIEVPSGSRRSRQLLTLLDELPVALNTVLLLALLCQVGAATIAGYWAQRTFGDLAVSVSSIVVTVLLFIYAEAVPKTLAVSAPVRYAVRLSPMVAVLVRLLRHPVQAMVRFADIQSPATASFSTVLSEPELLASAEEAARAGEIDHDDAGLIERSFRFGDAAVSAIMVPADRIVALHGQVDTTAALAIAIGAGHRRLPVTGSSLDEVLGHVRLRDLVAASQENPRTSVASICAEMLRCPPDEPVAELLRAMQSAGVWIALVVDDGRTRGLVTIEDIVAELVGEIADDAPPAT